ncbi:hypothetical protein PsyrH_14005 [Pseudomonas syringae pv. syringae HS191]|uniref:hypothetical protein n=1 Tax=Pseudomonas syringae TaxID=317 RepID=UPI00062495D1|nr:hypothetical protein [Pseudomonas syringae]AKF51576.1 hypothetical protein PsyrH_14005 [Pseudomonas syringae pv. syringae HS191]
MIRQIPKIALFVGALALAGQANADRGWGGPAVVGAIVGAAVVGAAVSSQCAKPSLLSMTTIESVDF